MSLLVKNPPRCRRTPWSTALKKHIFGGKTTQKINHMSWSRTRFWASTMYIDFTIHKFKNHMIGAGSTHVSSVFSFFLSLVVSSHSKNIPQLGWSMVIPNIWENKSNVPVTTKQNMYPWWLKSVPTEIFAWNPSLRRIPSSRSSLEGDLGQDSAWVTFGAWWIIPRIVIRRVFHPGYYPDHPCMVYLPTKLGHLWGFYVGKYTIHGWSGLYHVLWVDESYKNPTEMGICYLLMIHLLVPQWAVHAKLVQITPITRRFLLVRYL